MNIGNAKIDGVEGLHEFGKEVTQLVIDSANLPPDERERLCEERTRALLAARGA
jgi:hypothetical protein